jgi:lipoyl(octanoyl) transferase
MELVDLGVRAYEEVWQLQKQLLDRRARGEIADTLILVEHPAVYTVGRSGLGGEGDGADGGSAAPKSILVRKLGAVPVVEVERGGKLTFHGPGQLVGYPIFALPHHDLRRYLRDVERVLMETLIRETGLAAKPCPATLFLEPGQLQTGVWVGDRKIASIGIAVRKWVTYHGFALNLSTDLRYFEAVSPCGFHGAIMSSIAAEMGQAVSSHALQDLAANIRRGIVTGFRTLSDAYQSGADKLSANHV